jgi:predicted TPR repeat methyltransferase
MDDREASLRRILAEKPKNARAMAQLACVLAERAKLHSQAQKPLSSSSCDTKLWMMEAFECAERAVEMAPHKPFGYAALSVIDTDFDRRMKALGQAIECLSNNSSNNDQHVIALAGLLVRQLVEPREEQAKQIRAGKVTVGNKVQHPSQRSLDTDEESVYKRIHECLDLIWNARTTCISAKEREFIALREYRLGLLFRKQEPLTVSRARSAAWFQAAAQHLPEGHSYGALAHFWLATLQSATTSITQRPADYVVGLNATFATRFDDLLVTKLSYQTPTVLRQLLHTAIQLPNRTYRTAADLGCGTGLSGAAFCSCVTHCFTGVDLSPAMLAEANQRGCYDRLQHGDVTAILSSNDSCYDLVLACDVFCYIGDLTRFSPKYTGRWSKRESFACPPNYFPKKTATRVYHFVYMRALGLHTRNGTLRA